MKKLIYFFFSFASSRLFLFHNLRTKPIKQEKEKYAWSWGCVMEEKYIRLEGETNQSCRKCWPESTSRLWFPTRLAVGQMDNGRKRFGICLFFGAHLFQSPKNRKTKLPLQHSQLGFSWSGITFCQACLSLAVIPWETKQRECWKFWDSRCVQSLIRESVCDLPIFLSSFILLVAHWIATSSNSEPPIASHWKFIYF